MIEHSPYYSADFAREAVAEESNLQYYDVIERLEHDEVMEQIERGNLTVAMIRPDVGPEANLEGLSDLDCSAKIEEMIQGLGIFAKFSINFSEDVVKQFYDGEPKEVMLKAEAENLQQFDSRWPEFVKFMSSGPTTILLLHSENGDAISQWRSHLGHWNIDKHRDEATIRGKLGVNLFNNLVHGSDSIQSVKREIGLILGQLKA